MIVRIRAWFRYRFVRVPHFQTVLGDGTEIELRGYTRADIDRIVAITRRHRGLL